jgi:hypothetical protein
MFFHITIAMTTTATPAMMQYVQKSIIPTDPIQLASLLDQRAREVDVAAVDAERRDLTGSARSVLDDHLIPYLLALPPGK